MPLDSNVVDLMTAEERWSQTKAEWKAKGEGARQVRVPLGTPVKMDNGIVAEEITLRRPNVGEIRNMELKDNDFEREAYLTMKCAGLTRTEIDRLDTADYGLAASVVSGFLAGGPRDQA